jgi:hypothetical protein
MIEIKGIEPRDEKRQVAFFTIDGQEFSCGNVPSALTKTGDIQAYLDSRADEFKLLILRKQYPEADYLRLQINDKTELEAMEAWVVAGHKNKIIVGYKDEKKTKPTYDYKAIEKQELQYKHPKSVRLLALIEASPIAKDVKDLLKEIVK